MSSFLDIKEVRIPLSCANSAYKYLQDFGMKGFEGVALWAGVQVESTFEVRATFIPEQKSFNHDSGLFYSVGGDQLHRLNVWLYKNKMVLIAQIHSHPSEAYHSDTDDAFPIVTELGGLSLVVPDFASAPLNIYDWAAYRLSPNYGWKELSVKEASSLIKII